jgi:hypothetical protein
MAMGPMAATPTYVASDGQGLILWTQNSKQLYAASIDGGGAVAVADWGGKTDANNTTGNMYLGTGPFAALGGYAYFSTAYPPAVFRAKTDGSKPLGFDTIAMISQGRGGVAVDADHVYWVDGPVIYREKLTDIGDGGVTPEMFANSAHWPTQNGTPLALDADSVYWIANTNMVQSQPKSWDGGTPPQLSYSGSDPSSTSSSVFAIAVDPTSPGYVYWEWDDGTVQAAPKDGGATITIACSQVTGGTGVQIDTPVAIAVDCGAVYWHSPGGKKPNDAGTVSDTILKAAKPSP